ncbi:Uncharacterised protein [uncultured archaeon]|nr:Uncharacterised protein [uncultured archaeon]
MKSGLVVLMLAVVVLSAACLQSDPTGRVVDVKVPSCKLWGGTVEIKTERGATIFGSWLGESDGRRLSGFMDVGGGKWVLNASFNEGASNGFFYWTDDASRTYISGTVAGRVESDVFSGVVDGSVTAQGEAYPFSGVMNGSCRV